MNPTDDLIKPLIIEAIAKELKCSAKIEYITDELTKMHQEELISSELLTWAISETEKEHKQMLETSNVDFDTLLKQSPPVKLHDDDLYHASLCSNIVNKSSNTEQCVELLQGLSYESLFVSLSEDNLAFPTCMIAVSSDSSNRTATCYVAFRNIPSFKDQELFSDGQKSTFGKGTHGSQYACDIQYNNCNIHYLICQSSKVKLKGFQHFIWKLLSEGKTDLY